MNYIIATVITLFVFFLLNQKRKRDTKERRREKMIDNFLFKNIRG